MDLKINGKDYPLSFGLDFIAALDGKHYVEPNGIKLGQGLTAAVANIQLGNPTILIDLIQAATITEKIKPTLLEIKTFIENDVKDVEALMDDFFDAFTKAPMTKFLLKRITTAAEQATQ